MKVLVTGDRDYKDTKKVYETLDEIQPKCIVQGGARGADSIAALYAKEHGICCIEVKANWDYYGKGGGPVRNKWMLDWCYPLDLVVAFHDNLENSKGTKNMMKQAEEDGVEVKHIG